MHKYKESSNLLELVEEIIDLQSMNFLTFHHYNKWKVFAGENHAGSFFFTPLYTSLLLPNILLEADSLHANVT